MIDAKSLASMKPKVPFIDVARGTRIFIENIDHRLRGEPLASERRTGDE